MLSEISLSWPILLQLGLSLGLLSVGVLAFARLAYYRVRQLPLRKIRGPPSPSFLIGHFGQLFNTAALPFHEEIFNAYGNIIRINGIVGDTQIIVSDAKACTSIFLKEQDIFEESPWALASNGRVFGLGLLSTMGAHHRRQRKQLNPVFSIKHMRAIAPLFQSITHQFQDVLHAMVDKGPQEVDMAEWLSRLALELVAQGGLGHTPTLSELYLWREWFPPVSNLPPKLLRFVANCLPWPILHHLMHISDIMYANAKKIFDEKKALLDRGDEAAVSQIGEGKDILSVLLKANMAAPDDEKMPDDEIVAQMNTLLFAGTDTTSSALCRVLHLLSEHPTIQDKLRAELTDAPELDYDILSGLPYLDAVCRESLRLWPPVPVITRTCRSDISIPLSKPITTTDGHYMSSLYVPSNTDVLVDIRAINNDPALLGEDAAVWRPERWLQPLPQAVEDARIPGIYSNTLTFLGGGRACIGFKYSQLEMKVALSQLIRSFRFSPSTAEVIWRYGGLFSPSVKGTTTMSPTMPILVKNV
ncbi:cytochrome P450 [Artomyces pyxidatus]|uniref:Cytochrome P450 n=1 Tax=Artomyces pyxidatus TaxID=48021 RepID=A0ACB8SWV9_9AGAM|nr:cytochrome P450 [Artomyces pyxidatus]